MRALHTELGTALTAPRDGLLLSVVVTDVLARDLTGSPVRPPSVASGVRLARTDQEPVRDLLDGPQRRHVRPFLARGDTGFVAVHEGSAVGWVWLSRVSHRDPWSGLRIHLGPDEGYIYDLWTRPEQRHLSVGQSLMAAVLTHAQSDLGLARVYGYVDTGNRRSQLLLRLLGFTDVQTVRRAQVLRRRGWMLRGSARPPYGPMTDPARRRAG